MVAFGKKLFKIRFCIPALSIMLNLFVSSIYAQGALEVPVKVDIENGNVDDVLVKVMKNGRSIFTQSSVSKMKLKLNFNSSYSIVFSKPGYVTKTIEFDTKAPSDHITDGFDPYKIGVKLFKQYDGVNITVYNQPVGKIRFDKDLDEFSYDTDYSKSILSKLQDTEDKLAAKAKEEKKSGIQEPVGNTSPPLTNTEGEASPPPVASAVNVTATQVKEVEVQPLVAPPTIANDPPPPSMNNEGNDVNSVLVNNSGSDVNKPINGNGGEQNNGLLAMDGSNDVGSGIIINQGVDAGAANHSSDGADIKPVTPANRGGIDSGNGKLASLNGNDNAPGMVPHDETEKITREDIVEKNRIITLIKVTRGKTTIEYRRVNYHWGGPFYFRNDKSSISENIFVFATGIKD